MKNTSIYGVVTVLYSLVVLISSTLFSRNYWWPSKMKWNITEMSLLLPAFVCRKINAVLPCLIFSFRTMFMRQHGVALSSTLFPARQCLIKQQFSKFTFFFSAYSVFGKRDYQVTVIDTFWEMKKVYSVSKNIHSVLQNRGIFSR